MQRISIAAVGKKMAEKELAIRRSVLLAIHDAALQGQAMIIPQTIESAKPYQPADTGIYASSHEVFPDPSGATVGSTAPHSVFVEYGRQPNTTPPPWKAIEEWVRRKFRVSLMKKWKALAKADKGKMKKKRKPGQSSFEAWQEREVRQMTFLIRKKIIEKGIAPRHIYTRAHAPMKAALQANLEALKQSGGKS